MAGMGKGDGGGDNANREAYLQLAVTVLAAFARVPEIAASEEMVSKVPLFLEVMSNVYVKCYSFKVWILLYFLNALPCISFFVDYSLNSASCS